MTPATRPVQRPPGARLMVLDRTGHLTHVPRSRFVDYLQPGDIVVANDAATLPASLHGFHQPSGAAIEVRLAGRLSLRPDDVFFTAVVFGAGNFQVRTENRLPPPALGPGDRFAFGLTGHMEASPLCAVVDRVLDHPRLVALRFEQPADVVWAGLARFGRPIQYAHVTEPLALWDVWTPIAATPVAFEPPSAGFMLDWNALATMRERHIGFATITLAAGLSSTGDAELDRRLPFDEPYRISPGAAEMIQRTRHDGGRVIAVGTTVVRALEHAAVSDGTLRSGNALATQRIGPYTRLSAVDAILTGTHEPDSSHYQLMRAFARDEVLAGASAALEAMHYRTHEFGDSMLIEKQDCPGMLPALSLTDVPIAV